MKNSYTYETVLGKITISECKGAITALYFGLSKEGELKRTSLIDKAAIQIEEYLDGKRKDFDLPISLEGTSFQKRVWTELQKIPYGKTMTYSQIASAIGSPKAVRAVGGANNKNPISIIIPCHRVIGSDGSLTGYAGGLKIKEKLLQLEKGID
ncbi:MAG: methylated-DNA--[protein]-cysteine S-methyltransferase [Christensenellaceae bacterium]|jgi:methylated-DNA-[protein]-cysteine S-methyltransferase|nr:methylated-DNA--[protein]-cysteine S-methyltransferase [Christensenellaceae bacterium]